MLPRPVADFSCILVWHRKKNKNSPSKSLPPTPLICRLLQRTFILPLSGGAVMLWQHFAFFCGLRVGVLWRLFSYPRVTLFFDRSRNA